MKKNNGNRWAQNLAHPTRLQDYGYGFALSLCIAIMCGMFLLDRDLQSLEYETFMLQ